MSTHSFSTTSPQPFAVVIQHQTEQQQLSVGDPETAFGALLELLRHTPEDAQGGWGVAVDWPEPISLIVRYRFGGVGETRRVAHVVPMQPGEWHGYTLTAWCRTALDVPDLEFLVPGDGMPCVECLRRAPLPNTASRQVQA